MPGQYYEEFTVGETIHHEKRRTVSESDNQRFCDMTMNQQPLHMDGAFAAGTQFGERVVNGLYTMALGVGLTIPETTDGTIVANLGYDDVEHPAPVFHGDTLRAETTVVDKRETSDGDRGVVRMSVDVYRVDSEEAADTPPEQETIGTGEEAQGSDTLVCSFDRTVLSLKQSSNGRE